VNDLFPATIYFFMQFKLVVFGHFSAFVLFLPMLLLFDLPLNILVLSGIARWYWRRDKPLRIDHFRPVVTCGITCYSEGDDIKETILTLCEQLYPGHIEIIAIIDGASINAHTYRAALECRDMVAAYANRTLVILPKWQRGGRVSSSNAALNLAKGTLFFALDADTSFDNDMINEVVAEFQNPNVPAVAGSLRVRNDKTSLVARMQAMEYMISLQGAKTGLAEWNIINSISGAFGAFRTDFIRQIGGWDTHSGEDLDLTLRIKQYMHRHPEIHIPFAAHAIGHTDAPTTAKALFMQRLRWDGDLYFLYMRKHKQGLSPRLLGWRNYLSTVLYGIFQNILLPYLVVTYTFYVLCRYPLPVVMAGFLIQYLCYLFLTVLNFSVFICLISERPATDAHYFKWLFLYPIYGFVMRIVNAIAVLNEQVRRSHEESNMAPWWVLKKGKRF
jgi:biofilm PGA synthesis N-glycosyltransferase PgaC